MRRFARQALSASLLALHAIVMVCGPCLHALPGLDHGVRITATTDIHHGQEPAKTPHAPGDDCPVCHFFAQAQLPIDTARVPALRQDYAWHAETPYSSAVLARLLLTSPRAPPASRTSDS